VLPERAYSYTRIPTGYPVRRLLHSHEFETMYTLEDSTDTPRMFSYYAYFNSWQAGGNQTIPGAKDLIFGIDERTFYAAGDAGLLSLSGGNPYLPPGGMAISPYGSNIIQTNDRKIWFGNANGGVAYIDFPSGEVVTVASSLAGFGGPSFAMSGDGDNLFITTAQGGSQFPAWLINMTDYTPRQAPITGNDNELIEASVSDDGTRSINDWRRVRDGQFNQIGIAEPMVDNWVSTAAVISRDGRRAYTLAFDFDDFARNPTIHQPRVYVFDITTPVGVDVPFPRLGYFTLPDYPMCFGATTNCRNAAQMKISPDGRTLFLAGGLNLIIAPIPAENTLTPAAASPSPATQKVTRGIRTTPWRVNTSTH
jgi:hypothetical protein